MICYCGSARVNVEEYLHVACSFILKYYNINILQVILYKYCTTYGLRMQVNWHM